MIGEYKPNDEYIAACKDKDYTPKSRHNDDIYGSTCWFSNSLNQKFHKKIQDIVAMINPSWSNYEKALFIYNYMCKYFQFDENGLRVLKTSGYHCTNCWSACGLLLGKSGISTSFTELYTILLTLVGVPAVQLASDVKEDGTNLYKSWSAIKLENGNWYFVDVFSGATSETPEKYWLTEEQENIPEAKYVIDSCGVEPCNQIVHEIKKS